jgi:hypothetical protein
MLAAGLIRCSAVPFVLAVVLAGLCYAMAGGSLGVWLCGVAIVMLLVPAAALTERLWLERAAAGGGVVDGVAVVWLVAVMRTEVGLLAWLQCYVLLAAVAFAVWGLALMLVRARLAAVYAAAIGVMAGVAWLAWPVWLAPWAGEQAAALLVPAHPLFAINAVVIELGIWTQQAIAYGLVTLGQDVPYALPGSIWPAVLLHVLLGGVFTAIAQLPDRHDVAAESPAAG